MYDAEPQQQPAEKPAKAKARQWDDEELLALALEEQKAAVGFENDSDLSSQRIKSLNYAKGVMEDAQAQPNRSQAMSSDVSDGIETVLPDLLEIFLGEDVATFRANNADDEKRAEQETDYIRHVVMEENDGFSLFYSAFKDALTVKTGVFKWCWEEYDNSTDEHFEGKGKEDLDVAIAICSNAPGLSVIDKVENPDGTFDFVIHKDGRGGNAKVYVVPPEDFSVARDTVKLSDATYCSMRSRPRAQDLIAQGYDPDKVAELPAYGVAQNADQVSAARDTVNEQTMTPYSASHQLRTVEIVEHFLRLVDDEGKSQLYRLVTGGTGEQGVILEVEEADHIQFSAICPYPQTHRFYGRSLADLLTEIQKIKTALLRMFLDSGYFALNQRYEVADQGANEFTYGDLIRNEPGVPARSKTGNAIRPITAGGLNFDATSAMEFISAMAEQRTGVVRNANGLNPDSLHDTATGAQQLIQAAQKRTRMIARIFAETGVRDMFLGVHALIRTHAEKAAVFKLRNAWIDIDPTQWGERKAMSIEIGVGSGGRMQEMQAMQAAMDATQKLVEAQGGLTGPLVTTDNIYNLISRFYTRALGMKSAAPFITDPKIAEQAKAQQPPQPPPPDPEMVKAQMAAQQAQADAQADQQTAQAKLQLDAQLGQAKLEQEAEATRQRLAAEMELERYKADQNMALQQAQIQADTALEHRKIDMQAQVALATQHREPAVDPSVAREPGDDIGNAP